MTMTKHCGTCNTRLPLVSFTKDSSKKDKLRTRCRLCDKRYRDRPENKTHHKNYMQEYNKAYYNKPENKIKNRDNCLAYRSKPKNKTRAKYLYNQRRINNPKTIMLYNAKSGAKQRGLECNISIKDIPDIPKTCPIFKMELKTGDGVLADNSTTLDRIDNNEGYVSGNIHIISWKANRLKSNATLEELQILVNYLQEMNK